MVVSVLLFYFVCLFAIHENETFELYMVEVTDGLVVRAGISVT